MCGEALELDDARARGVARLLRLRIGAVVCQRRQLAQRRDAVAGRVRGARRRAATARSAAGPRARRRIAAPVPAPSRRRLAGRRRQVGCDRDGERMQRRRACGRHRTAFRDDARKPPAAADAKVEQASLRGSHRRTPSSTRPSVSDSPRNAHGDRIGASGSAQQALAQRQQMAGEVAAVDGRHVARRQRLQRLGVVPVVEMAAVARQRFAACASVARCARSCSPAVQVAEVVGGQVRPAATGRCWSARCGARPPAPDVPGCCPAAASGRRRRRRSRRTPRCGATAGRRNPSCAVAQLGAPARRAAGPATPSAAAMPPTAAGCGAATHSARRLHARQQTAAVGDRERRGRTTSSAPNPAEPTRRSVRSTSLRRTPLQQPSPRRPAIRHSVRTIASRLKNASYGRQASVDRARAAVAPESPADAWQQVGGERHVDGPVEQVAHRRQHDRRDQQDRQQPQRPASGCGRQRPAEHQQRRQRGGHQAAAQVVEQLAARQPATADCARAPPRAARHARQQPRQQLPVAADPAMPALDVGA